MKIFLLITISSIFCKPEYTLKHTERKTIEDKSKLESTISVFQCILNKLSDQQCYFNSNNLKNTIPFVGIISKYTFNICFLEIKNLEQLNNFNKEISENMPLSTEIVNCINVVISLTNSIWNEIPDQNLEISTKSNNFLKKIFQDNNNYCKISATREHQNIKLSFKCHLKENTNTLQELKPNEKKEEEESKLLYKKQK